MLRQRVHSVSALRGMMHRFAAHRGGRLSEQEAWVLLQYTLGFWLDSSRGVERLTPEHVELACAYGGAALVDRAPAALALGLRRLPRPWRLRPAAEQLLAAMHHRAGRPVSTSLSCGGVGPLAAAVRAGAHGVAVALTRPANTVRGRGFAASLVEALACIDNEVVAPVERALDQYSAARNPAEEAERALGQAVWPVGPSVFFQDYYFPTLAHFLDAAYNLLHTALVVADACDSLRVAAHTHHLVEREALQRAAELTAPAQRAARRTHSSLKPTLATAGDPRPGRAASRSLARCCASRRRSATRHRRSSAARRRRRGPQARRVLRRGGSAGMAEEDVGGFGPRRAPVPHGWPGAKPAAASRPAPAMEWVRRARLPVRALRHVLHMVVLTHRVGAGCRAGGEAPKTAGETHNLHAHTHTDGAPNRLDFARERVGRPPKDRFPHV